MATASATLDSPVGTGSTALSTDTTPGASSNAMVATGMPVRNGDIAKSIAGRVDLGPKSSP